MSSAMLLAAEVNQFGDVVAIRDCLKKLRRKIGPECKVDPGGDRNRRPVSLPFEVQPQAETNSAGETDDACAIDGCEIGKNAVLFF